MTLGHNDAHEALGEAAAEATDRLSAFVTAYRLPNCDLSVFVDDLESPVMESLRHQLRDPSNKAFGGSPTERLTRDYALGFFVKMQSLGGGPEPAPAQQTEDLKQALSPFLDALDEIPIDAEWTDVDVDFDVINEAHAVAFDGKTSVIVFGWND